MASDTIELHSPHSPAECARRLRLVTDPARRFRGKNPLIGLVEDTSLRLRRRIAYRNSFQIYLFATVGPELGGSRISCTFRMHGLAIAFIVVWFSLVGIGLAVGIVAAFDLFGIAPAMHGPLWPAAILPILMAVFAWVWLKLARKLAIEDEAFLIEFLRFALDAEPETQVPWQRAANR
ncbi:MAG: hypothetical protein GC201_10990 [Alphaproteobacteria bacterium]|nr:hypothetical protein [Alphaproteobacteria bacterium]